jgi:hypothetical protein
MSIEEAYAICATDLFQSTRHPMTVTAIEQFAPKTSGVWAIWEEGGLYLAGGTIVSIVERVFGRLKGLLAKGLNPDDFRFSFIELDKCTAKAVALYFNDKYKPRKRGTGLASNALGYPRVLQHPSAWARM